MLKMEFKRDLHLKEDLSQKSLLLLGPRQTGKSSLLRKLFPDALNIDLLSGPLFRTLSSHPETLEEWVRQAAGKVVVIDEVQKIPALLDEAHRLIERDSALRLVLTGSSARRLRKQGVNLLGGRARKILLHPITTREFGGSFEELLRKGGLPRVLNATDPYAELEDYASVYLREEIQAEAAVRNLDAFSRFLQIASAVNGEQVIFSHVGSDSEVPARTVREYFQLLEDTLVGTLLPAFTQTTKRKAMTAAKFYFFDVGLANVLQGRRELRRGTVEYGRAFEHLVWRELQSAIDYLKLPWELFYWRTTSQIEVDWIVADKHTGTPLLAIEAKAKDRIGKQDLKGLARFAEEYNCPRICVSLEPFPRTTGDTVEILPAELFFERLWSEKLLTKPF